MSAGGWFEEDDRILSDINITPLVDVSLVLLIIFMITAPMMVQGALVELPETRPMDTIPDSQIIVSITAEGDVLLDGEPVGIEGLEPQLAPRMGPGGRPVQVHGDHRASYGRIMEVMAVLRRLQAQVGLVIEPIPERR